MGFIDDVIEAYERERSNLVLPELSDQDTSYNRNYVESRRNEFYDKIHPDANWADTSFELMKHFAYEKSALLQADIDSYKRRKDLLAKGIAAGVLCDEVLPKEKNEKRMRLANIRTLDREQMETWYPQLMPTIQEIATVNAIIVEKIEAKVK